MYITVHDTVVILAYKVWNYTSRVTTSMGLAGSSSAGCLLSGTVGDSKEDPGDMRGGIYELSPWKFFRKAWTWFMGKQGICNMGHGKIIINSFKRALLSPCTYFLCFSLRLMMDAHPLISAVHPIPLLTSINLKGHIKI